MRVFKIIIVLSFSIVLFSCATGSYIVTDKARPAISLSEVKIYLEPPSQYETIGIVEASSEVEFSSQAAQDRAINELKIQAAKIGANGVLLLSAGDKFGDTVGLFIGGIFYMSSSEIKAVKARAIFVIQE